MSKEEKRTLERLLKKKCARSKDAIMRTVYIIGALPPIALILSLFTSFFRSDLSVLWQSVMIVGGGYVYSLWIGHQYNKLLSQGKLVTVKSVSDPHHCLGPVFNSMGPFGELVEDFLVKFFPIYTINFTFNLNGKNKQRAVFVYNNECVYRDSAENIYAYVSPAIFPPFAQLITQKD